MKRTVFGLAAAVASLAVLATLDGPIAGQGYVPSTKNGDWTHHTADVRGTKYSPLDQVTAANFNQLEVAWRFKTSNLGTRPEYKLEGTPLAIRGTLYTTAGTRRSVIALDGKTGELMWTHSYREGNRAAIAPRAAQSGSPMTYKGPDGRQYIVVAVSGGNYSGEYISFALPSTGDRPTAGE